MAKKGHENRAMLKSKLVSYLRRFWHFIWEDNSIWSWIANIILAFLIIRFLVYPGLGFMLGTTHPIVAVVSNSMEHDSQGFSAWFDQRSYFYQQYGISKEGFKGFDMMNGFNKGDIIFLMGKKPDELDIGDIIVFKAMKFDASAGKLYPVDIIHRVIRKWKQDDKYYFQTKGDRNPYSIESYINRTTGEFLNPIYKNSTDALALLDETLVNEDNIVGKASFRVPWLGWVKLAFSETVSFLSTGLRTLF